MTVTIRPYAPSDAAAFKALNEAWITHHFALEEKDREILDDPQGAILSKGGGIVVAEQAGETIGCVAVLKVGADSYELAKMAVDPACRGAGVGAKLIAAAITWAQVRGASRMVLESNSTLQSALRLYERYGFTHVRDFKSPYARADVRMERSIAMPALDQG